MDIFELNYANSEYYDRHKNHENKPKQKPIEWHKWDELIGFFRGYFGHFGDDVTVLDEETFKRMVKTIWRMGYVAGVAQGREDMKNEIPSFREQLQNWFKDIQRHNEEEENETFPDRITPTDIWTGVLSLK